MMSLLYSQICFLDQVQKSNPIETKLERDRLEVGQNPEFAGQNSESARPVIKPLDDTNFGKNLVYT